MLKCSNISEWTHCNLLPKSSSSSKLSKPLNACESMRFIWFMFKLRNFKFVKFAKVHASIFSIWHEFKLKELRWEKLSKEFLSMDTILNWKKASVGPRQPLDLISFLIREISLTVSKLNRRQSFIPSKFEFSFIKLKVFVSTCK